MKDSTSAASAGAELVLRRFPGAVLVRWLVPPPPETLSDRWLQAAEEEEEPLPFRSPPREENGTEPGLARAGLAGACAALRAAPGPPARRRQRRSRRVDMEREEGRAGALRKGRESGFRAVTCWLCRRRPTGTFSDLFIFFQTGRDFAWRFALARVKGRRRDDSREAETVRCQVCVELIHLLSQTV